MRLTFWGRVMSDVRLPYKASVDDVAQQAAKAVSRRTERGFLVVLCALQLAWIAALGYGVVWLTQTVAASF